MTVQLKKGQHLADLFAGTGGVARAARRQGICSLALDTTANAPFDVLGREWGQRLRRYIRTDKMFGAALAPPCLSWTVARNRTKVLRTKREPEGVKKPVTPLTDHEKHLIEKGIVEDREVAKLVKYMHRLLMPWVIENPYSSNC